jgi:hypothetical protein
MAGANPALQATPSWQQLPLPRVWALAPEPRGQDQQSDRTRGQHRPEDRFSGRSHMAYLILEFD